MTALPYRGRFAPSPTGLLHAGSMVAALASWLDARQHGGRWLLRIEDVDGPRCVPGAGEGIIEQLMRCGLLPDEAVTWQSQHGERYAQALAHLVARGWAYPCACSRSDIEAALLAQGVARARHAEAVYPGTCRNGLRGRPARSWRLHTQRVMADLSCPALLHWHDRRLGAQLQNPALDDGDFVLRRADGLWAYQLAVVVDDAAQGITHVVRGADLLDNTPRQLLLQRALDLPEPRYLHTPLACDAQGEKLSKQTGAQAVALHDALDTLNQAARVLGLPPQHGSVAQALAAWQHGPLLAPP